MSAAEKCPNCGSELFGVIRDMTSRRRCRCGTEWPYQTAAERAAAAEPQPAPKVAPLPDAPTDPQALLRGQQVLERLYGEIDAIEKSFTRSRELSLAITNLEQGLLWFRQAVYLQGYGGYEAPTHAGKNHL